MACYRNNDINADGCVYVANAREVRTQVGARCRDSVLRESRRRARTTGSRSASCAELTNGVGSTQEYSVAKYPAFKLQGVLSRRIGLGKARRTTAKHDDNRKYAQFECTTAPASLRHFDVDALKSQPPIAVQLLDKLRTSPIFSQKPTNTPRLPSASTMMGSPPS
ncbi:hypothetical protein D9611_005345 [Ephemerocybe angulata]|uniref:Uncharacterized protein n=1 Tax=Ephemerocybe angulata TaxID=980116 RepID=A0A8H5C099_9AGAR|nr:hypothetical protein D9611_005345 [Tulosesus angulatus]